MSSYFVPLIAACTVLPAMAQGTPEPVAASPAPACERAASAPAWLPCGPDRVLSQADIKTFVHKDGYATKM